MNTKVCTPLRGVGCAFFEGFLLHGNQQKTFFEGVGT